mmetsp:Transcript_21532/g.54793  ORF Transcript_21532/g.54793 Transcript_21532/m.54793 type:complete len:208 (-) Transcript_21532:702-1325(-)
MHLATATLHACPTSGIAELNLLAAGALVPTADCVWSSPIHSAYLNLPCTWDMHNLTNHLGIRASSSCSSHRHHHMHRTHLPHHSASTSTHLPPVPATCSWCDPPLIPSAAATDLDWPFTSVVARLLTNCSTGAMGANTAFLVCLSAPTHMAMSFPLCVANTPPPESPTPLWMSPRTWRCASSCVADTTPWLTDDGSDCACVDWPSRK